MEDTAKRVYKLPNASLDECRREFEPLKAQDNQKWLHHIGIGSCTGNFGGPLVSNNTLIRLVSWSVGCEDGYPTIYKRVFPQLEWIKQTID